MDCKQHFLLALPTSLPPPPAPPPAPPKKNRKKTYITLAAVIAIIILVTTAVFVPQINADIISLGVHYKVGEKLTYDVTTAMSSESTESSSSYSTDSTVTIEVLSFEGDTYKLNYTSTTSTLGYSMSSSKIVNVKESEMVTALALLPVAIQGYVTTNETGGLLTGFFNQSQAKVGDTWTIPVGTTGSSETTGEITVTFKAIQDITVPAGTYKVFRIDFSQVSPQDASPLPYSTSLGISGQAYLESGTCKQIKSELTMDLSSSVDYGILSDYSVTYTFTSTLAKDEQP